MNAEPASAREPEEHRPTRIRPGRIWYLLCFVPLVAAAIAVVVGVKDFFANIEAMQRFVVPGEHTITLGAGDHSVFGESVSFVDGVAYRNPTFRVSCALLAPDGSPVKLDRPTATTTYTGAGYQGESMFELSVPRAGSYRLTCDGDSKGVLAIGDGPGGLLLFLGVFGTIAGIFIGGGLFTIVFIKRRKARGLPA